MRKLTAAIGCALSAITHSAIAAAPADTYPTKPIRVIAAFPPGGGVDIVARAGTPKEIIARLNRETVVVLGDPDLKARLAALGIEVSGGTPDALRAEVHAEFNKWSKVLKEGNIKQE